MVINPNDDVTSSPFRIVYSSALLKTVPAILLHNNFSVAVIFVSLARFIFLGKIVLALFYNSCGLY